LKPNLKIEIAGIKMKNPVMTASGTFGYGQEYSRYFDLNKLGAIVVKGTTLKPKLGNPQPRICETPSGMINSIGLQNVGVDSLVKDKLPFLRRFNVPVIVNIAGNTAEEFRDLAKILDQVAGLAGLEVNISCPNVKQGGISFGIDAKETFRIVARVKNSCSLPVLVKLTPNVTDIVVIARAAKEAGADALSLINTLRGAGFVNGVLLRGGLSGPCLKPHALWMVDRVAQADLGLPIVGLGGITNAQDALEFLKVGATAIAIGTAFFVNPLAAVQTIDGLKKYLVKNQINSVSKLRNFKQKRR